MLAFDFAAREAREFSPEDAELGPFTISRGVLYDGRQIAFRNGEGMDEASGTLRFYTKVHNSTALWLGASHQYAINEFEPGGEMMVYHANRLARERSASSSCLSVGLGTRIQAQGHRGKISLVMRPGGYNGIDARRGDRLPEARRAVHILSVLAPR